MKLLETVLFENECFRDWLNIVDAIVGYDTRLEHSLVYWRELFDEGHSPASAIETCREFGE